MPHAQTKTTFRQSTTMDPLKAALEELASEQVSRVPASRKTGCGPSELIESLLELIDETVLPRRLSIKSGDFGLGELTVAHRRLTSISLVGSSDQNSFKPPNDPEFAAKHYAMCIKALAALLGDNTYQVEVSACDYSSEMVSCSIQRLEEVLRPEEKNGRLSAFLSDNQGRALAWLLRDKGAADVKVAGDERIANLLVEFAGMHDAALPEGNGSVSTLPGRYFCSVLSLNSAINLLWLGDGRSHALVAMSGEHSREALRRWDSWVAPFE